MPADCYLPNPADGYLPKLADCCLPNLVECDCDLVLKGRYLKAWGEVRIANETPGQEFPSI